jgi:hypothetical protein
MTFLVVLLKLSQSLKSLVSYISINTSVLTGREVELGQGAGEVIFYVCGEEVSHSCYILVLFD